MLTVGGINRWGFRIYVTIPCFFVALIFIFQLL